MQGRRPLGATRAKKDALARDARVQAASSTRVPKELERLRFAQRGSALSFSLFFSLARGRIVGTIKRVTIDPAVKSFGLAELRMTPDDVVNTGRL